MSRLTSRSLPAAAILTIGLLPGAAAAEPDPLRLGHQVEPTFQRIELVVNADRPDYSGSVRVELRMQETVQSFRFHAEDLTLHEIKLTREGERIPIQEHTTEQGIVTVHLEKQIPPGDYSLEVEFSNDFDTTGAGLYRLEVEGRWYVFSVFEPDDARTAFPCWDEPSFKIPYQFVLSVPDGHRAFTNTAPEPTPRDAEGGRIQFGRTKPLSSYLLFVAAGPFEVTPLPGLSTSARIITVEGRARLAAEALRLTPPILHALESYFAQPYPYDKLDLIAVPESWLGGMEHPGAVTFRESLLLIDPEGADVEQRRTLATTLAHELAHMWFGNLVSITWWDDLWLKESFASWIGDKITEEIFPDLDVEIDEVRRRQTAMEFDALPSSRAIRHPVLAADNIRQSFDRIAYLKGEAVLETFEQWIGPDRFRKGIRGFLHAHEWGTADAADLWRALSTVEKSDVARAISTFLDQAGVPIVRIKSASPGKVRVSQRQFRNFGTEPSRTATWRIPVNLKFSDGTKTHVRSLLLTDRSQLVDLGSEQEPAWIHPNSGESGYYRWWVEPSMLAALATAAPSHLSSRERIGLLGNLSALLDAGEISGGSYLELLGHFRNEPNPEVVRGLLRNLRNVQWAFVTDESRAPFGEYVRSTLRPVLDRIGFSAAAGEAETVSLLRSDLFEWLGDLGRDAEVLHHAKEKARRYLEDPASVDPSMATTVLHLAAMHGDEELFEEIRRRFETTEGPTERVRLLTTLASFRTSELVDRALAYTLEGPLRSQEIFQLLATLGIPENRDRLFGWVMANYDGLTARIPESRAALLPWAADGCSSARLETARAFFGKPEHRPPGTDDSIEEMGELISACVALRAREFASVLEYLEQFVRGTSTVAPD